MIGNGNGGIIHPGMMRVDPKILQAIQYLHDLSPNLAGLSASVVTKDGNAAKITAMSPDVNVIEKAIVQHLLALLSLATELGRMSQEVQEKAPPVGQILRPGPPMGG